MTKHLDEIIKAAESIPPLPMTAIKLSEVISRPTVSAADIAEVLQYDPAVTANLLRLCSTAYFGFSEKVVSVKDAVVKLGTNEVFQLVMASTSRKLLNREVTGYALPPGALWRQSVGAALSAQKVSRIRGLSRRGMAFTAGLLLDIGKLALDKIVDYEFEHLTEKAAEEEISFVQAEEALLGISHPEMGARLAESWSLPAELVSCIRYHHNPHEAPEEHRELVSVCHLADLIAITIGFGLGSDGMKYQAEIDIAEVLHLKANDFDNLCVDIVTDYSDVKKLFLEN